MKKTHFIYLLLCALLFSLACKKSKQSNPCDDVLNEGTPTQIGLTFVDKQTGENILLTKNIDTATITITPEPTDLIAERGVIIKEPNRPMYGSLVFHIEDTKKGAFKYKVTIPGVANTTLSYVNTEEESDNKCNPYYIKVNEPVIEDHEFTVIKNSSRIVFQIAI